MTISCDKYSVVLYFRKVEVDVETACPCMYNVPIV